MRLIEATDNDCVAASLAMVFRLAIETVKRELFTGLTHPFPDPWSHLPKVPAMVQICDWVASSHRASLTPYPYNPTCAPHPDCPPVMVYAHPDTAFQAQLNRGQGVIEGRVAKGKGHMVAWDGNVIYDPRGYCYSLNVAVSKFGFTPSQFWLVREDR